MIFNEIEYLILRLARKYFFPKIFLSKYGNFIPYYKITSGQSSPNSIVKRYLQFSAAENLDIKDKDILEIGVGITNSTCYELVFCGARSCYAYEPYAQFNNELNNKMISRYPQLQKALNKVTRVKDLEIIHPQNIDIVFSNSVLEHIKNIDELCQHLKRIMKNNAWMIHIVDYRDHFFKYQFNFYKFNKKNWKIIDPGLSRLRISDHIKVFNYYGFETKILDKTVLIEDFIKFKSNNKINQEFSNYSDTDLATVEAVILVKKR